MSRALYRKTALVQAVQWRGQQYPDGMPVPDALAVVTGIHDPEDGLGYQATILTREGEYVIREGDYLCGPGPAGEYWPVGQDIFHKTYQLERREPVVSL